MARTPTQNDVYTRSLAWDLYLREKKSYYGEDDSDIRAALEDLRMALDYEDDRYAEKAVAVLRTIEAKGRKPQDIPLWTDLKLRFFEPKQASSPLTKKKSKKLVSDVNKALKKYCDKLKPQTIEKFQSLVGGVERSWAYDGEEYIAATQKLRTAFENEMPYAQKSSGRELVDSLIWAIVIALILRSFFIEPFKIPTRSMVPTVLDGDQLFVSKLAYGIRIPFFDKYIVRFSEPGRGDVVVFSFPRRMASEYLEMTGNHCLDPSSLEQQKDYIKRVIAVAGDTVEVIGQNVIVNGAMIERKVIYKRNISDYFYLSDKRDEYFSLEKHGGAQYYTVSHEIPENRFGPVRVKDGNIFVMGDNRDNSADSRCWGQVPIENVKGKSLFIWWSSGAQGFRFNRIFRSVD